MNRTKIELSVPLSSGQWLHLIGTIVSAIKRKPFSPLVVGAMAASTQVVPPGCSLPLLSVPLSSGQWLHLFVETGRFK